MRAFRTALMCLILLTFLVSKVEGEVKPGQRIYTIQLGAFKSKEEALKLMEKLNNLKVRVVFVKNRYKVRVGIFKSYKEAFLYAKEHKIAQIVPDFFISKSLYYPNLVVYTNYAKPKKVKEATSKPKTKKDNRKEVSKDERKELEKKAPDKTSLKQTVKQREVQMVRKQEALLKNSHGTRSGRGHIYAVAVVLSVLLFVVLFFTFRRKNFLGDFEVYVGRLFEEGNYEKVIETAIPYLQRNPKDTFTKKLAAESFEKLGMFIEAGTLYEEIAEELGEKGFSLLKERFKEKAERLLSKEFRK